MASPSLTVRPGSPDTPQFVDIDCSGMELSKTLQLLVNDVVRASVPVDLAGGAVLSYVVPAGPVRNALADLVYCSGTFTDAGELLCGIRAGSGDSMALRYQP